ncbi:MAG: mechanosensitive ion channel family protein [Pseudomonadota bacterium]|nr:mechanosensitive ion channel family protein [Pseudomonadota bacterium]
MDFDLSDATQALQAMAGGFVRRLPYLMLALLVFGAFYAAAVLVRASIRTLVAHAHGRRNLGLVVGRLSYGAIIFVGLLVALVIAIPGFTPGQLANILGLSSVAIGFAFRDILQNFLAGILLLASEPFRIGDQIVINEFEGTVEDIQTRATFLMTYDGRRVVIPNANLFTNSVTVNTAHPRRRLEYDFGLGYGDDIANAKRILLDVARATPGVLEEPAPDALVVRLADSSINVRLRWWVQPPRQFDALVSQDLVLEKAAIALHAAGIDIPFPTQQILFHDQTEESDGDRARQREGWPPGQTPPPRPARQVQDGRDAAKAEPAAGNRRED